MPNVTETTLEEMEAFAEQALMDGIIAGQPIAKSVTYIVETAFLFGLDEAERRDAIPYGARYDTMDQVKRDAIASVVEGLFGGKGLRVVLRGAVRTAAAFGFQQARERIKLAAVRAEYPIAEAAFDRAVSEQKASGKVTSETSEALFAEIIKMGDEIGIGYAQRILTEHRLSIDPKVPSFKAFTDQYARIIC